MIDWSFPPDLQARYETILAQTRRLQAELGIKPRSLEQRAQDYLRQKQEKLRKQEELKQLQEKIGRHRPITKWKV